MGSFSKRTVVGIGLLSLIAGCASSSESASQDQLTANVGKYPTAPSGVYKPRVGVPPFAVKATGGFASGGSEAETDALAADEMSTLLDQSDRFQVIERAQLQKLLDEQNMEGIVRPGEMAKTGQVRGVDYLLIGKVTNLRVKSESNEHGFGLAQVGGIINLGGADVKKKEIKLTTEAGVDIRLVNPTTGQVLVSNFSEYNKTDSAGALGVDILGASANADADIQVSQDDKGKILRLALDDALRKSLPKIDKFLRSPANQATGSDAAPAAAPGAAAPAPAGNSAVVAKRFCPTCGAEIPPGAKFCPKDGTKIE